MLQDLPNPELSVRWLADAIRCSADYLSHLFRVETGQTLTGYINEERQFLARHLLRNTAKNVSEIARGCGYQDPSYFTRVFTRHQGQSPRSYRRARAG